MLILYPFLFPNNIPSYVWDTFLFVSSFAEAQLGSFYFGALRNNTVMGARVTVSLRVGAYSDVSLVSAKHLVIWGTEHSHIRRVSESVSGVWVPQLSSQEVEAACPPVPESLWLLTSSLRVKAHRKQTARRRQVTNDEDPVMGTVPWVSDVGVFS